MIKKISTICFILFISLSANAQKESTWWYFGNKSGINFSDVINENSITPIAVNDGPISTGEGCFSLSDRDGNFLVGSDGITIYNKNRLPMENGTGLLGHSSSTQSGIFVPRPGHPNNLYVITVSARESTPRHGINYSEIDLSQNGGLGKVISKNLPLNLGNGLNRTVDAYENIAVVRHNDNINYWLVHRSRQYFFAWLITKDGIDPAPVMISDIGFDLGVPGNGLGELDCAPGYLKFSPDGRYLAHAGHGTRYLTFAKFDDATGEVFEIKYRQIDENYLSIFKYVYSVEFSPTGNYLFFGGLDGPAYSLPTNNFFATPTSIGTSENVGTMQMGPDYKIYAALGGKDNLYIITNPDEGGTDVTKLPAFFTDPYLPKRGFPNFAASLFNIDGVIGLNTICINSKGRYRANIMETLGVKEVKYLAWDFGDGTPIVKDIVDGAYMYYQEHIYTRPDVYTLTLTPYLAGDVPLIENIFTLNVTVGSCALPVNPLIRSVLK